MAALSLAAAGCGESPAPAADAPRQAAAEGPVCERKPPRPKLTAEERVLRETVRRRKELGFRHDRAFVRRVNADPASRRRAVEGYFPMTRRERRYALDRERLSFNRGLERLSAYMRRHGDDFGELSIEDDFPRGAYIRVPVVRDVARHRPAIRGFGVRHRIVRARWSHRELLRLQERIDGDDETLAKMDIHVIGSAPGRDRVKLEVATQRDDVREVLRDRYGPAVRVFVIGKTRTFLDCRRPQRYEVAADGVTLTVHWGDSGSIEPSRVEVVETTDTVYLGAVVETSYFETSDLQRYSLTVELAQPLGGRAVKTIEYEYPVRPEKP